MTLERIPVETQPKIVSIPLPEYSIETQPDYEAIGRKIDEALEENFMGQELAVRSISMYDHPQYNMDEMLQVILEKGTDKYDPNRKGVAHVEFEPYQVDMQAGFVKVGENHKGEGMDIVKKFYENALIDRGYRLRIDLVLLYDLKQLKRAEKVDPDKPSVPEYLELYLFQFKDPEHKQQALVGIIKLLH